LLGELTFQLTEILQQKVPVTVRQPFCDRKAMDFIIIIIIIIINEYPEAGLRPLFPSNISIINTNYNINFTNTIITL